MSMKKHPPARSRRWRPGRSLLAVGILATLSVGAAMPTPAGAATSTNLLYSTDGGATWSSNATVPAGGTVLVRQWFDNDGSANETAASLRTTVPVGFSRQGGSTQVCLNPSTTNPSTPNATERRCATSAEGSVWSGSALQISPSAGHFGESNGSTSGDAVAGRKRYLNLHQCRWTWDETGVADTDTLVLWTNVATNAAFRAGSNVKNIADSAPTCGAGASGYALQPPASADLTGVQAIDLLGNRYLNLHQCAYNRPTDSDNFSAAIGSGVGSAAATGTNASNAPDASVSCGGGNAFFNPGPGLSRVQTFDLSANRYLHLHTCTYRRTGADTDLFSVGVNTVPDPAYRARSEASNSPTSTLSCGAGVAPFQGDGSPWRGVATFDLLDTARGRGYVQYALTAPAAPSPQACAGAFNGTEAFTQDGTYQSAQTSTLTSSGNLTVDFSALADPCPVDPIPTVDPVVGGALVAVAGAGYLLYRRTRPQLV